jgi:hypothetical protein
MSTSAEKENSSTKMLSDLLNNRDPDDPKAGVLLEARDWVPPAQANGEAFFQLFSGGWQESFVSISNLFDRLDDCERIIDLMAQAARRIKNEKATRFTCAVACTATAKLLLERLHAKIEDTPGELAIHYLGSHPFLNPETYGALNFEGEDVLIVTDVISSGSLVSNLAMAIRHVGGKPKAALALLVTDAKLSQAGQVSIPADESRPGGAQLVIPLYSLETKHIERLTSDELPPGSARGRTRGPLAAAVRHRAGGSSGDVRLPAATRPPPHRRAAHCRRD